MHLWQQQEVGLQTWVLWQQEVVLWQLNLWFSCLVQQGCGCQAIGSSRKKGRGPRFIHSMPTQLGHTCRHKRIERVKFPTLVVHNQVAVQSVLTPQLHLIHMNDSFLYIHTICDESVGTQETYFNRGSDLTSKTSAFPSQIN